MKAGFRHSSVASKQIFLCRSCGRKFTPDNGFLRMRYPPEIIREAVSLKGKGFSLAEIRLRLERKGVRVSRWSIANWARRFSVA
jgi:transposase-like protein